MKEDPDGAAEDMPARRSVAARIGIAALNLLAPGLGLVRIGRLRCGIGLLVLGAALPLLLTGLAAVAPPPPFPAFVVIAALLLSISVTIVLGAMILSWRHSRLRGARAWWSRWPALAMLSLLSMATNQGTIEAMHRLYKPFYLPTSSMAPTIEPNERIFVDMRGGRAPRRGDIILFQAADGIRISRVAATARDSIAMHAGVPIVNGRWATQIARGTMLVSDFDGRTRARLFAERLPGEAESHSVLRIGASPVDSMPAVRVPPGSVFVLGDNRNRSADSRVPIEEHGVGMVPLTAIIGRPLFIHWSAAHARIGTRLSR